MVWSVDLPWDFVSSAVRLHPRPPSSPALLAERSGGESLFKTRGRRGAFSSLFSSEAANYSSPVSQPASKLQGIDRLDRGGRSIDRSIDTVSALKMSVKNRRVRCQVLEKACEINAVERGRYPGTNWSHERASPVKRRGKIIVSISNENYSGSYSSNLSRK